MKTILVPTDYSDVAGNALQYAIELAKFSHAKLLLLHTYQIPVPTGETPIMRFNPADLENDNLKRIKNLEKQVFEQTKGEIRIESQLRLGFTVDEILNVSKENEVDLVVMGITGTGKLSKILIGSRTTALIKQTQTPVLVVPKDARYRPIEKILLAYNYNEAVNVAALDRFKKFAKLFNAKVLVLDVEKPVAIPVYENTAAAETLENSFKGIEHDLFYGSSDDLADEMNEFADAHNCDWVAMIPHTHSFFSGLFHESNTKRMAFHTHIPLLAIHD